MSPGEVEQTKLLANALDRASTACITVGIATPFAGYLYNFGDFGTSTDPRRFAVVILAWIIGAVILHYLARRVLKGLDR